MSNLATRIAAAHTAYREAKAAAATGDRNAEITVAGLAVRLARLGAPIEEPPAAVVVPPPPAPAPAPKPVPVSREDAIRRIGAAHAMPAETISAALADGMTAGDFALATADHVAEQRRQAEIERVALRIANS